MPQIEKVQMDAIITEAPYNGGKYVFTNHQEIRKVDEMSGKERISYVADAEWIPLTSEEE